MASWYLVPCLVTLREEFNALNSERDKGADGSIGDTAHQARKSDHNPDSAGRVHALDIDSTGPWPRPFRSIVMDIIENDKRKWEDPNDICRLEYVILDAKIYERDNDFEPVDYNGSDPHRNHAHFSARHIDSARNNTRPFMTTEDDVTDDDINRIADRVLTKLDDNLATATTNSPSGIVRNLRRITVQYPFAGGYTVQSVFEKLWTSLTPATKK